MDRSQLDELNERFERAPAQQIIEWALEKFGSKLGLASSFSAEDMVLIDMLSKLGGGARVFSIDTGRLHQETYELMDIVRERYGIPIEVYFPRSQDLEEMVNKHGMNAFYKSKELRILCCHIRKVEPLKRALSGLEAWMTGLRREQSPERASIMKIEIDHLNGGILKLNPLADWSSEQVWDYIRVNQVPYNPLYDRGYASIGCVPCTRPIKPGEHPRAGRWWWENEVKECGLHWRFQI